MMAGYISYAFHRVGEVTETINDIDRIMGMGFNWAPPSCSSISSASTSTVTMLSEAGVAVPRAIATAARPAAKRFFHHPQINVGTLLRRWLSRSSTDQNPSPTRKDPIMTTARRLRPRRLPDRLRRNWTKENKHFSALMRESVRGALERRGIAPEEVESAHVGNFAAELYCMQGHLGAFFTEVDPAFSGLPTGRHEAACASGRIALLAASAEIEAGPLRPPGRRRHRADEDACSAAEGGAYLGTAAWYEQEAKGIEFPFPKLFGRLGDEYDKRYGLKDEHLAEISRINYDNAKLNPNAQTRTWYMNKEHALCRDGRQRRRSADGSASPTAPR